MGIFEALSHRESRSIESPFAVLALVTKGRSRAHLRSRGTTWDFSTDRNTMGLFGPRLEVAYSRWECEPGAERMVVELDFDELAAEGDLGALLPPRRALQQDLTIHDEHLATLLRLMADEIRQGSPHGRLYATSLSLSLAAYLSTHHAEGGRTPVRERGALGAAQKSRVIATVEAGLARDLDLAELAEVAGVSRFHFLRLFKNTFGMTPHRYVLDQRLAAARRMLETTALPIAQVALATGFSSQSHLSTAMRRSTGLSPSTWRRMPS
jgi:AraC family transcriptional regulator